MNKDKYTFSFQSGRKVIITGQVGKENRFDSWTDFSNNRLYFLFENNMCTTNIHTYNMCGNNLAES